jgi:hypothetical protein
VKARLVRRDEDTDAPIGFLPQAFELKDGESYLSASWVEFFPGSLDESTAATLDEFGGVLEIRKKDLFARGVVANIKETCRAARLRIRVTHEGDDYPSHSAVRQMQGASLQLLELLAAQAWAEVVAPPTEVVQSSRARRRELDTGAAR